MSINVWAFYPGHSYSYCLSKAESIAGHGWQSNHIEQLGLERMAIRMDTRGGREAQLFIARKENAGMVPFNSKNDIGGEKK